MTQISIKEVLLQDLKTANMRLDIREARQAKKPLSAEQSSALEGKSKKVSHSLQIGKWYEVEVNVKGAQLSVSIDGQQQTVRDVYGVYNGGTKPGMRSVKQGDWKLVKYDVMNGSVRETQLFNLKDNPNEFLAEHHAPEVVAFSGSSPAKRQVNLATDPKHSAKLEEMEALLLAEMGA